MSNRRHYDMTLSFYADSREQAEVIKEGIEDQVWKNNGEVDECEMEDDTDEDAEEEEK